MRFYVYQNDYAFKIIEKHIKTQNNQVKGFLRGGGSRMNVLKLFLWERRREGVGHCFTY